MWLIAIVSSGTELDLILRSNRSIDLPDNVYHINIGWMDGWMNLTTFTSSLVYLISYSGKAYPQKERMNLRER